MDKCKFDNGFPRGVLAIRIYFKDGEVGRTPYADLLMTDRVVETIQWTEPKQRKPFEAGINGYTLIYDERPKMSWEAWLGQETDTPKPAIYRVTEVNVDGCGGDATEFVQFSSALSGKEELEFEAALMKAKKSSDYFDTTSIIKDALSSFGKQGELCSAPYEGAIEF